MQKITFATEFTRKQARRSALIYFEALTGTKTDLRNVRTFGYNEVVYLPTERRTEGKFDPRGEEGLLVSYSSDGAYKVYIPAKGAFRISKDVTLTESERPVESVKNQRR